MKIFANMKKRLLWCGFAFAVVLLILMISTENNIIQRIPFLDVSTINDIRCYDETSSADGIYDFDPESNVDKPTPGRNIFFHETSCFGEEGFVLNARQACAVESAARMNPTMTVYLLFVSKSEFSNSTHEIIKHLLNYRNIKIRHIYPDKYVKGTPLEAWYTSGALKKSHWPVSHMSDMLRYLTLWKYGGIYLDLDVVVTSSLENLTNFAGAEDWDDVAAGVMGFDMSELGRRVADACVRDLKKNFRGDVFMYFPDTEMLIPSRCIFFHKTSCSPPYLTSRQACAVESAARNNRNLNVFVLFFATGQFSETSQAFVDILQTYDNVYIRRVRLSRYVIDTPLENWFLINLGEFSENHDWLYKGFHDYIRMLTLWKFGGVVLNLNSIVLTSLDELTTFAGVQDNRNTDVGVFGVDTSTNFGKNFVNACIEVIKNINPDSYSRYNITRVITEVLQELCYQRDNKECRQFTIYPPEKFYPVLPYSRNVDEMKIMKNATTIHLWTDHNQNIKTDAVAIYRMTIKQHCPKIYEYAENQF